MSLRRIDEGENSSLAPSPQSLSFVCRADGGIRLAPGNAGRGGVTVLASPRSCTGTCKGEQQEGAVQVSLLSKAGSACVNSEVAIEKSTGPTTTNCTLLALQRRGIGRSIGVVFAKSGMARMSYVAALSPQEKRNLFCYHHRYTSYVHFSVRTHTRAEKICRRAVCLRLYEVLV